MWRYQEIRTLGDYPAHYARSASERIALNYAGRETTYGELERAANQTAYGLGFLGLGIDDRVVYLGKNSDDYFIALFGAVKQGCCFCPLNWRLSKSEIKNVLADVQANFAFVEAEFQSLWSALMLELGLDIPTCEVDPSRGPADPFQRWLSGQTERPLPTVGMDAGAIQLYTSGTTGDPKGVVITHDNLNHMRLCEHFEPALAWQPEDRFLVALPNFHLLAIGLSLQSLYNGMAVLIERQFDPAAVLHTIGTLRPTITAFAPAMIQMLLDHPHAAQADFSSLRLTMYAGSPISLGLIRRAIACMPCEFMQFYGATETSGAVTLLRPAEHDLANEQKLKSCGKPLPLIELRVVDGDGHETPIGEPGELLIRSPALASGYWHKPQWTSEVFVRGWYHSGDIAYRDAEGLYYIHDRLKDMIVSGGENIYSSEIESVLSTHPAVAAAAVVGVPDERWGEAVKACVILVAGTTASEAEVIEYCRTLLAGYKLPKSIDFMSAFPMTGSGKIAKKELRAPYWAQHERSVA